MSNGLDIQIIFLKIVLGLLIIYVFVCWNYCLSMVFADILESYDPFNDLFICNFFKNAVDNVLFIA